MYKIRCHTIAGFLERIRKLAWNMGKTLEQLGTDFKIGREKVLSLLVDWDWIDTDGMITDAGERVGLYSTHGVDGSPLVRIPSIIEHRIKEALKRPKRYKAQDGHYLASRAELIIDEWLAKHGIAHKVDYPLPFLIRTQPSRCDFYLPEFNIYIEFWGLKTPQYLSNKEYKISQYEAHRIKRIDLEDDHLFNLDFSPLKALLSHRKSNRSLAFFTT